MEAAFAIATARDKCLQLLLARADREIVKLAWSLAFMDGVQTAYDWLDQITKENKS